MKYKIHEIQDNNRTIYLKQQKIKVEVRYLENGLWEHTKWLNDRQIFNDDNFVINSAAKTTKEVKNSILKDFTNKIKEVIKIFNDAHKQSKELEWNKLPEVQYDILEQLILNTLTKKDLTTLKNKLKIINSKTNDLLFKYGISCKIQRNKTKN